MAKDKKKDSKTYYIYSSSNLLPYFEEHFDEVEKGDCLKVKLTEHDLMKIKMDFRYTSVYEETNTIVITNVDETYEEKEGSEVQQDHDKYKLGLIINELNKEVETIKNEMLKDRAELENFKKRTQDERLKQMKYANQGFAEDLINVIDIFDKIVSQETQDENLKKYLVGFQMINNQFQQTLENYGVKKIDALNKPFDPNYHDSIELVEKEGVESNICIEVVRNGYMFKDRVIQPAMVKVSK